MKTRTIYAVGLIIAFACIFVAVICGVWMENESVMVVLELIAATIISVILSIKLLQWPKLKVK